MCRKPYSTCFVATYRHHVAPEAFFCYAAPIRPIRDDKDSHYVKWLTLHYGVNTLLLEKQSPNKNVKTNIKEKNWVNRRVY